MSHGTGFSANVRSPSHAGLQSTRSQIARRWSNRKKGGRSNSPLHTATPTRAIHIRKEVSLCVVAQAFIDHYASRGDSWTFIHPAESENRVCTIPQLPDEYMATFEVGRVSRRTVSVPRNCSCGDLPGYISHECRITTAEGLHALMYVYPHGLTDFFTHAPQHMIPCAGELLNGCMPSWFFYLDAREFRLVQMGAELFQRNALLVSVRRMTTQ